MNATKWTGVGEYDALLDLSENEMRELADYYKVDWTFFTDGPSRTFEGHYFCFISFSRKALALLPFLSIAFGGMYNGNLLLESESIPVEISYDDYVLEEFEEKR